MAEGLSSGWAVLAPRRHLYPLSQTTVWHKVPVSPLLGPESLDSPLITTECKLTLPTLYRKQKISALRALALSRRRRVVKAQKPEPEYRERHEGRGWGGGAWAAQGLGTLTGL